MTSEFKTLDMPNYERRLDANRTWALREGGMFFQNESEVQKSLRRITGRLRDLGIEHAVIGDMALFLHGYRRFTEVVNLLLTPDGLARAHASPRVRTCGTRRMAFGLVCISRKANIRLLSERESQYSSCRD